MSKLKFLSKEWHDKCREMAKDQPERPGASTRLQYVVTGGPDGDVKYWWVIENGLLTASDLGELEDAEITLTQTYDDAELIQKGELEATTAFMQGRIKASGSTPKLMSLLPITTSPEYRELQVHIREITDYGEREPAS